MNPRPTVIAAALLSLCSAVAAPAQDGPASQRSGFFWGLGLGAAHLSMDCGRCAQLPDSIPYAGGLGAQVGFLIGGAISPHLLLAFGGTGSAGGSESRETGFASANVIAHAYPRPAEPVFVRGGVGISQSRLGNGEVTMWIWGISSHLEVGLDAWRRGRRSIGPYVGVTQNWNAMDTVEITGDRSQSEFESTDPPRRPRSLYLGVGATWY